MEHPQILRVGLTTVLMVAAVTAPAATAQACPNESVKESEPYAFYLPDCRAYEQVSPVNKNGNDALGEVGQVRAATSGPAVTYFSLSPFPSIEGGSAFPTYLSTDTGGAWTTGGLLSATEPSEQAFVTGLTPRLTNEVLNVRSNAGERAYIRDTATGALAPITSGGRNKVTAVYASAAADGNQIVFNDSGSELIAGIHNETFEPFVYEWNRASDTSGDLSVVSVVNGAPVPAVAGASTEAPAERAVSEDGKRVYFTDTANGHIFLREPVSETTRPVSAGEALWRAATPDGRFAFYTEQGGLFRFDADSAAGSEATSVARSASGVLGVLGTSVDGTRAYFVATEVLAGNTGARDESAVSGGLNLYEWHENAPLNFIAGLNERDEPDWFSTVNTGEASRSQKTARVAEDGMNVMLLSRNELTLFDNASQPEVYLYSAVSHEVVCASCNSHATSAVAPVSLTEGNSVSAPRPPSPFETHNLSTNGNRVYFQTSEALVSQDSNGLTDVYEWERNGEGSCNVASTSYVAASGGCLYLISTGQGSSAAYFGDASPSGADIYFFTRQQLVRQDTDNNLDIYDAREDGGLASQNVVSTSSCESEGGCRGNVSAPPVLSEDAGTQASAGAGHLPPINDVTSTHSPKQVSRAQQLAGALKVCKHERNRATRNACVMRVERRYGAKKKAKGRARAGRSRGTI